MPGVPRTGQSYLGQQSFEPPPEGSILPAELLVVGQHRLQPRLQPLQIFLLLPPGLTGRFPVLDHSLLPLQQLCLCFRKVKQKPKMSKCAGLCPQPQGSVSQSSHGPLPCLFGLCLHSQTQQNTHKNPEQPCPEAAEARLQEGRLQPQGTSFLGVCLLKTAFQAPKFNLAPQLLP